MNDDLINTLRATYKKKLPEKIENLELQWDSLQKGWDNEKIEVFYKSVHMLNGSAGSYGYPEISEVTKELEVYLKELLHSHQPSSPAQIEEINKRLERVNAVINKILLSDIDDES